MNKKNNLFKNKVYIHMYNFFLKKKINFLKSEFMWICKKIENYFRDTFGLNSIVKCFFQKNYNNTIIVISKKKFEYVKKFNFFNSNFSCILMISRSLIFNLVNVVFGGKVINFSKINFKKPVSSSEKEILNYLNKFIISSVKNFFLDKIIFLKENSEEDVSLKENSEEDVSLKENSEEDVSLKENSEEDVSLKENSEEDVSLKENLYFHFIFQISCNNSIEYFIISIPKKMIQNIEFKKSIFHTKFLLNSKNILNKNISFFIQKMSFFLNFKLKGIVITLLELFSLNCYDIFEIFFPNFIVGYVQEFPVCTGSYIPFKNNFAIIIKNVFKTKNDKIYIKDKVCMSMKNKINKNDINNSMDDSSFSSPEILQENIKSDIKKINHVQESTEFNKVFSDNFLNEIKSFSHIPLNISVELGSKTINIKDFFNLSENSIIELDQKHTESLNIFVNDCLIAKGELVVMNEKYGIRITSIISTNDIKKNFL